MRTSADGFLLHENDGITSRASAREIWNSRLDDFTTSDGLTITGIGRTKLKLTDSRGIKILVETEIGDFDFPTEYTLNREYVILNRHWIPLNEMDLKVVENFFTETNYKLGAKVNPKVYANLLALKSSGQIKVEIATDIISHIKLFESNYNDVVLKVEPYEYQKTGIEWLCNMYDNEIGALLCDQMGLGKTLQLIALTTYIMNRKRSTSKILIVVPNSLKENWIDEFQKFTNLKPYKHYGDTRAFNSKELKEESIILTTYDTLIRDFLILNEIRWESIICDEAHSLKNPNTMRRSSIAGLNSKTKFLATGTPVENRLEDLWSLMDLIRPGILGDQKSFTTLFQNEPESARNLGVLTKPIILRRLTKNVLTELPDDIYIDQELSLDDELASAYEYVRLNGISESEHTPMIAKLQILRMFCCYPPIVIPELSGAIDQKSERLLEILDEIYANEIDKVIIFTSFIKSSDYLHQLIQAAFPSRRIFQVDGRTTGSERSEIIKEFNTVEGFSVLIANPKVAGEGLNIVSANHVIHFNREWNPQKENQASARVLRPGQTKKVFIHRFFYAGTVEEVINAKLTNKSLLADSAMDAAESEADNKSIHEALNISPVNGKRRDIYRLAVNQNYLAEEIE